MAPHSSTLAWKIPRMEELGGLKSMGSLRVIDVFLELSCFFHDPADVGNLISVSSAFSKTRLDIWKFTVHVLLKPGSRILSITSLACEMSAIVW